MSTPRFLDLPPGVRHVEIATPTGTIAALEAVPTAGGCERQPAVLVPGLTGSKEDFIALLQTLAQAGRRVHALDLPGQYQSPGSDDPDSYTCASLGRAVAALVATLGDDPVHLLGHSFGGLVTRETVLAAETPLLSYTLMSSGPGAITGERAGYAQRLMAVLRPSPTRAALEEMWDTYLMESARSTGLPAELVGFLRNRMVANHPLGLVRMAEEITTAPDRTAELAALPLPTLVLYGENDDAWPTDVQADMAARLAAERVVVPGAAHSPNVEAPETTASALTLFWNNAEHRAASAA
ncbi:pimeloyl-ACP methyl ester carboxylesterase [Murinocardiopsis flavida]|uniref:Pimeloyl-ACP methyl ester carboxylesterase n=1 Tax=Murinocardiopsis flavida TaxID=645275 RepID=A0A2P8DJF8_9ACTN|nr:alpha/beta hydrolase [Murinocardiopsis flavida]PSK97362.1 pimeloyl-ACP methyl ester carboxylesterase [Murinocardiopsis flavida]